MGACVCLPKLTPADILPTLFGHPPGVLELRVDRGSR